MMYFFPELLSLSVPSTTKIVSMESTWHITQPIVDLKTCIVMR